MRSFNLAVVTWGGSGIRPFSVGRLAEQGVRHPEGPSRGEWTPCRRRHQRVRWPLSVSLVGMSLRIGTQHLRGCVFRCDSRRHFANCVAFAGLLPSASNSTVRAGVASFRLQLHPHSAMSSEGIVPETLDLEQWDCPTTQGATCEEMCETVQKDFSAS